MYYSVTFAPQNQTAKIMRKVITLIACAMALLNSQAVIAQDTTVSVNKTSGKKSNEAGSKSNIVKMNLSALAFKNLSFQYERVVAPKMSVALGVSLMPQSSLPFSGRLNEEFGDNEDAKRAIETTKLGQFSITPEVRFYLGKKRAPRGFYLAPFARYTRMSFEQKYQFTASNDIVYNPLIKGTINNFGGGLLIGAQWALSNKITLDWWIAGPLYGSSKGHLKGTDDFSTMSDDDMRDLENDIEDFDIPLTKVEATVAQNQVDVKLTGPYAGIRAFGIALGFRF